MTRADGLSLAWPAERTGVSQKTRDNIKTWELDRMISLPFPRAAGCLVVWPRPFACSLTPVQQTATKLGIRANYAYSNHWADICEGMKIVLSEGFKKKSNLFFPSYKHHCLLHSSTSHSSPPVSQAAPIPSMPSLPLYLSLSLSLRHGQGRISRQSLAVQTQLYDRKDSQPWERNFPSEHTH